MWHFSQEVAKNSHRSRLRASINLAYINFSIIIIIIML